MDKDSYSEEYLTKKSGKKEEHFIPNYVKFEINEYANFQNQQQNDGNSKIQSTLFIKQESMEEDDSATWEHSEHVDLKSNSLHECEREEIDIAKIWMKTEPDFDSSDDQPSDTKQGCSRMMEFVTGQYMQNENKEECDKHEETRDPIKTNEGKKNLKSKYTCIVKQLTQNSVLLSYSQLTIYNVFRK